MTSNYSNGRRAATCVRHSSYERIRRGQDSKVSVGWGQSPGQESDQSPWAERVPSVTRAPQTHWARSRGCELHMRWVPRVTWAGGPQSWTQVCGQRDGSEPENMKALRKERAKSSSNERRAGLAEWRAQNGGRQMLQNVDEMWRWGLKIWKLRILLQKAEASPKTYSTKLGKSDTVRCRGWWFLLSRRWQPSGKKYHVTQAQEPGKGMMAVHLGWRRRPSAGGSEATSWGRTADVWRAAPPEGSEGQAHRDGLPAAAPARVAQPEEQGWPVQLAGRRQTWTRVHSTGHRQRGATGTDSAGLCAQSDPVGPTGGQQSN